MTSIKRVRRRAETTAIEFVKKGGAMLSDVFQGALFFGGLAAISFGAWMFSHPVGVMLAGAFAVWASFLLAGSDK